MMQFVQVPSKRVSGYAEDGLMVRNIYFIMSVAFLRSAILAWEGWAYQPIPRSETRV
jgi:hypothetical protein